MKKTLGIIPMMIVFLSLLICVSLGNETQGVENGQRYERLVIQNVLLIDGKGTPMRGPVDIILQGNRIQSIRPAHRGENVYAEESHILDGTGLYVLPGLINIHAHIHDNRGGIPIPFAYLYKLWLASGITTVRDVGSNYEKTIEERQKSQEGVIAAPRIFLYMSAGGRTPDEVRHSVQRIKARGSDGVKIFGMDRDIMKAALEEAHRLGLRVAHHVGVEETDAWDDASFGVTSIEHWFKECLHPVLEKYFEPNPAHHGSYFWNWTTTDETFWRENYKIWMKAVRQFADMGGLVGCGEDAGYIYMLYGFSLIRELELH